MQHRELGLELLKRIKADLINVVVEQDARLEGRQMTMLLAKGKPDVAVEVKEELSQ